MGGSLRGMILVINTTDSEKVFIGLVKNGIWLAKKQLKAQYKQAEKLLPAIDKVIQVLGFRFQDLQAVAVISGPGPFTALRVGVTTANTLGWSLKIPVVAVKRSEFSGLDDLIKVISTKIKKAQTGQIAVPVYGKEPNITRPK